MGAKWALGVLVLCAISFGDSKAEKVCPVPEAILPCRCLLRGEEYQIWCTHSDLPSVLEGLKATAKFIKEPVDELILENNYLPALPGRAFYPLKILRLMLRYNGLERVSNDWLGSLETTLMELFIVEPKLRTIPEDSLSQHIALQAVTIQTNLLKRLPLFSGLPKLRYLQIESTALIELSARNFKNNPTLEKLYIGQCSKLDRLEADLFVDLPSLTLLNITNCGIAWMHHRAITRLPVLQELVLTGNRIADAGMVGRSSRELPELGVLRLDDNYIDILGEAAFVDLPSLRELHLSNNRITELHHGAFHRVPLLRKLNLNGNFLRRVHPESFLQESGSGLEELWLVRNEISHVADLRAILDALPRLVFLDMSYNQLEAIPFGSLRGHPTLEYFNLDHNGIHLIDREAFVAMPALRELRLRNNSLSNNLLPPLWNLPQLKGLDLSQNYFRRLEPTLLQDLPSLRKINLSKNELTIIDPEAFSLSPALEHINISSNGLATLHPATFRPLLNLYELDISNNALIEFVPGLPRGIEYLHLRNNQISMFPLAPTPDLDLPALRMLDLTSNKIEGMPKTGFDTLPQLRKLLVARNLFKKIDDGCLKGLTRLETLDASENGVAYLGAKAFQQQSELRDLNLGDNRLEHLQPECFQHSPHLKRLNLTKNLLSEILPGTLDKNHDLQMVDLSNNRLVQLPSTFVGLKNLRMLDLAVNRLNVIDPEILGSLPSLRVLKLSKNFIKELKEHGFTKLQHLASLDLDENELEFLETNAMKTLPVLKKINLSRNKIKEIPKMVFVNLPSLQMVELQENQIKAIAPNAFVGVPHLLTLNLSYNHIETLEDAGLRGVKSLELLDVSHNLIGSVASYSLENMEWLVELRMDNNRICGVQGSSFNSMPRLRVLSIRNNKMMSFPERAVERIRSNIAVLDIEGNPLACSCNMLWLQAWLLENGSLGPKCADGYLLREHELSRRDCPEEERNVEIVAPGCEAELLSAPGVYGNSRGRPQWMNIKAVNGSESRNNLPPSPEQSEYFYDEYVDYPYNDTTGELGQRNLSSQNVPGDFPGLYASSKNKNIPKIVSNSPSSSGFTFFGIPLPHIASIIHNAVTARRNDMEAAEPTKMRDRVAIVNKPTPAGVASITRVFNALPNTPKIETGGFVPMLPGEGGFQPISNALGTTQSTLKQGENTDRRSESDTSTVETMNVARSTTNRPTTMEVLTEVVTTTVKATLPPPFVTLSNLPKTTEGNGNRYRNPETKPTTPRNIVERKFFNRTNTYMIQQIYDSANEEFPETEGITEKVPETTTIPNEETTILKIDSTTVIDTVRDVKTTVLKPVRQEFKVPPIPQTSFLIPGNRQPSKNMATISKVPSSNVPSASASFRSDYDALPPMAHNREPKTMSPVPPQLDKGVVFQSKNSDMHWYLASYNSSACSIVLGKFRRGMVEVRSLILILWAVTTYLL
ncbi:protein artichoke [Euwallacea similis]|uniref:protein artichoke n=1 Tax=Euwallacea similis TaxID=1736056 RepID=UPI00344FB2A6